MNRTDFSHDSAKHSARKTSQLLALGSAVLLASTASVAMASVASATNTPSPTPTHSNNGNASPGAKANPTPKPSSSSTANGSINGLSSDGTNGHYAVTICHATRSASNPYVVITVDASSITRLMSDIGNGHGKHTGPVFNAAVNRSGDNWGDIIPAVKNPVTGVIAFPGLNTGNLDWIARGCVSATGASAAPTATPTSSSTASPTGSPSATTPTGVNPNANPSGTAAPGTSNGTASGTGSASGNSANGPANANSPAAGSVGAANSNDASRNSAGLPGSAVLPAGVPAGDGSSVDQSIPVMAIALTALALLMVAGSAVGVARSREHADSA